MLWPCTLDPPLSHILPISSYSAVFCTAGKLILILVSYTQQWTERNNLIPFAKQCPKFPIKIHNSCHHKGAILLWLSKVVFWVPLKFRSRWAQKVDYKQQKNKIRTHTHTHTHIYIYTHNQNQLFLKYYIFRRMSLFLYYKISKVICFIFYFSSLSIFLEPVCSLIHDY